MLDAVLTAPISPWWLIPLTLVAVAVASIATEGHIWCLYGYVTCHTGQFPRWTFRALMRLSMLLVLVALVAPWVMLFLRGLWVADLTWLTVPLMVFAVLQGGGRILDWWPHWFFDVARARRVLRELPHRHQRLFDETIEQWPALDDTERAKFLEQYHALPLHHREAFFFQTLDALPRVGADVSLPDSLMRLDAEQMKTWAGAHLFNQIEGLLDIRHRLAEGEHFHGPLPIPADPAYPEAQGEIVLAHVGEDLFAIGRARD